ncbi:FecCD family ABC transporter permease [Paenibacillus hexagrammi]|uniref:Iron ABC transporter permease n=1 Tax=Paenibacillus hexagrammi TaxID=2908839 RepID=A0ABY3SRN6_9BACL|nr:iron ABC transporter permease [Paenibacillus sp. YPD9-1]UJF36075.1 iron ABC transporter permease [Paenibacillus sp. YPD9-1]
MRPLLHQTPWKAAGLMLGIVILLVFVCLSIVLGATKISWITAWDSFIHYQPSSTEHVIIRTTRLPRALFAAMIGVNLAVAGALMQALTRNALASPGIFGINAGAVFFVVLALACLPITAVDQLIWVAFAGAALASTAVYLLGSLGKEGMSPMKVVIAGAAMSALFGSLTQGMLVMDEAGLQNVMFWLAGSVAGKAAESLLPVLPYMLAAGAAACLLAHPLNILSAGEDISRGLGQRGALVRAAVAGTIVVLAGSSVAVAGSIGFVGLVTPHIARFLVGVDYRWVIPYSAVLGAVLLLAADIAARYVIMPGEAPIGVMTAVIGVPFFLYMARKSVRAKGGAGG